MLITFEGIDGCGKTTQIELVKNYLADRNYQVVCLREPGGTVFAEKIREILLFNVEPLTLESELCLFEAARSDLVRKVILPELSDGKIILCDRFYDSTTAYQGFGRGLDIDTISKMNELSTGGVKPDLTFYLNISIQTSEKRSSGKFKDNIELSGNGFFSKVVDGYKYLCANQPQRIIEIDAEGNIEETFCKIINVLSERL